MDRITGMIQFALQWSKFYEEEIQTKLAEEFTAEKYGSEEKAQGAIRAQLLSLKGPYRTITETETGFAFYAAAQSAVLNESGEFASASFVDEELETMQAGILKGVTLSSKETKKIKQRIQSQQLSRMRALEHFGLFTVEKRAGSLQNTTVNYYVITDKGRELMSQLKGGEDEK